MVDQGIGLIQMALERDFERGQGFLVKAGNQFRGARRSEELIEENFQARVGNSLKAQWRFAHLADALAQGRNMLSAKVGMKAKSHFQFVNGLRGNPGGEDLGQPLKRVMISFEASDAFFNRQAWFHRPFKRCDTAEGGNSTIALAGAHSRIGIGPNLSFLDCVAPAN